MQEPQRLLARLNAVSVDWQDSIRVTGDVLRAEDIAAGLAGLERGPYLLSLYMWTGDSSVALELYGLLLIEAKRLAIKHNWRCKNSSVRLLSLIKMAMYEQTKVNICNPCKGTGVKQNQMCSSCNGIGNKRPSQTEYAGYCGVKVANWKKCWDDKYSHVLMILIDWEEVGISHLLRKL